MDPKLFIRADATTQMGIGHVMRCIALAQGWQDRGGEVTFLSYCESDTLRQRIQEDGFKLVPIEKPHPEPGDMSTSLQVLNEKVQITDHEKPLQDHRHRSAMHCRLEVLPWFVTDGYHFDSSYQKTLRAAGARLMVIDDYSHLPYYHADILYNQNINAKRYEYSCDQKTILLLGTDYVLLRREFLARKDRKKEIPTIARNVLVTLGGADLHNLALMAVKALNKIELGDLQVRIAAGPANPHVISLENEIVRSCTRHEVRILRNANMPELMAWADLAISTGGSTCWELAFMGVPSLVLTIADNHDGIGKDLEKIGVALDLGWYHTFDAGALKLAILDVLYDRDKRIEMSENGKKLVDGKGIDRLFAYLAKTR